VQRPQKPQSDLDKERPTKLATKTPSAQQRRAAEVDLECRKKRNGSSGIPEVPATLNGRVQCHIALKLDLVLNACKH
jgi:hypothetical protein